MDTLSHAILPQPALDAARPHTTDTPPLNNGSTRFQALAGAVLHDLAGSAQGAARQTADAARSNALLLHDSSSALIRARPMQSVLVAVGAGAAAGLLLGLVLRGLLRR
jgi:ElaB/YqjD/DUF883 family membrane-anchored ribosome-binding protein